MEDEYAIRESMERTRESLTDKLETLEDKVLGTVQDATSAVRETVASVKEGVKDSVESVKDAVDVPAHVQRHPWLTFGGAVLGGYVLANLLVRAKETPLEPSATAVDAKGCNGDAARAPELGVESPRWITPIEPELRQLKSLALGVTFGTIRELLTEQVNPGLADHLRVIVDGVTKKVGGEPIARSDLPFTSCGEAEV